MLCAPSPEAFYGTLKDTLSRYAFVGAMRPDGWKLPDSNRLRVFEWGAWGDWETLAQRLFFGLRALESLGVHAIVCHCRPKRAWRVRCATVCSAPLPSSQSRHLVSNPLLKVPPASRGNRTRARFPSRSGGNLRRGGMQHYPV
jgi:hypothetical protein